MLFEFIEKCLLEEIMDEEMTVEIIKPPQLHKIP